MAPETPESPPPPPPVEPARYAVTAPGPVTGGVMGVGFANGQAIADSNRHARALDWFRSAGYAVQLIEADPAPPADDEPAPEPEAEDPEPEDPAPAEEYPDEDDSED
ncbi:hypothetical protein [Streptomyces virginiae]|uniref:hypothetical protein n=1 Tax=Streptomyces virginiae TaxID=1961 RepID=UPI0036BB8397